MPWTTKPIRSNPDPDDPKPWYDLEWNVEQQTVRITRDADGGLDANMTGGELDLSDVGSGSRIQVYITLGGTLTYAAPEDQPPVVRAHLTDISTPDDLTWLEFVEDHG